MDIHNKKFKHRGRNGYDRYEVDSFLDDVVDNYGDALDQVVDLKNEVVSLNKKVEDMQAQVDEYSNMKKSLISAQKTVDQLKENAEAEAKRILDDAKKEAQTEVGYQKQQQEVISNDYKRLKKQIGEFRSHMQAMLQDEYFHTERFYPGNGAEPIGEEEEIANETAIDDEDIDNDDVNDVNSSQEPDDLDEELSDDSDDDEETTPKPMTGDSPHHETINLKPEVPKSSSGPTIVFPDDYKK